MKTKTPRLDFENDTTNSREPIPDRLIGALVFSAVLSAGICAAVAGGYWIHTLIDAALP